MTTQAPSPSSLEVLIRTHFTNGTQSMRGICGNGAYSRELPIVGRTSAAKESSMSKLSQQLEKACAAQPQFRIAFEDLRNATITISQGGKGKPNELKAEWTCTEQKSGMPTTRRWEETTAPDAPLPTPGDLTKMAKQMSDICGFRMQEASARY